MTQESDRCEIGFKNEPFLIQRDIAHGGKVVEVQVPVLQFFQLDLSLA